VPPVTAADTVGFGVAAVRFHVVTTPITIVITQSVPIPVVRVISPSIDTRLRVAVTAPTAR
jgi:hypothetical protein